MRPVALERDRPSGDVAVVPRHSCRRRGVLAAAAGVFSIAALGLPYSVDIGSTNGVQSSVLAPPPDTTEVLTGVAWTEVTAVEAVAEQPVVSAPAPEAALAEEPAPPDPCSDALAWVAEAGLRLPPGVGYHCPSTQFAHHGAACWNGSPCRGSAFIAINLDLMAGTSPEYLRHVVAHEVCHILDWQRTGTTSEPRADACAAAHGAPA